MRCRSLTRGAPSDAAPATPQIEPFYIYNRPTVPRFPLPARLTNTWENRL